MLQTYLSPRFLMRGQKCFVLNLALTLILLANSYTVLADQSSAQQNLQTVVAAAISQEAGGVTANDKWTRIEFSKPYTDPIIVVDPIKVNDESAYVVGIRNVDTTGFEINLRSCNSTPNAQLQETVNYSVLENSGLSTRQGNSPIRQVYAWGECPA